jgi:hypothetical protein
MPKPVITPWESMAHPNTRCNGGRCESVEVGRHAVRPEYGSRLRRLNQWNLPPHALVVDTNSETVDLSGNSAKVLDPCGTLGLCITDFMVLPPFLPTLRPSKAAWGADFRYSPN